MPLVPKWISHLVIDKVAFFFVRTCLEQVVHGLEAARAIADAIGGAGELPRILELVAPMPLHVVVRRRRDPGCRCCSCRRARRSGSVRAGGRWGSRIRGERTGTRRSAATTRTRGIMRRCVRLRSNGFALSSDAGRTEHPMTSRFICNLKDGAARFSVNQVLRSGRRKVANGRNGRFCGRWWCSYECRA